MIIEFGAGLLCGIVLLALILFIKAPWIHIWGQYKEIILSVDKSNKGIIATMPKGKGQWGEIDNPAGKGTILAKSTPIWIPALRQRWYLHYGENAPTVEAKHAAAASHWRSLGIRKKDMGIVVETKGKTGEQIQKEVDEKLKDLEKQTDVVDAGYQGVFFDLRESMEYFSTAINPEEINALTNAAAIEYTGLKRMLEQAKKGFSWLMIIVIIFGAIAAIFVLPSLLKMIGLG